jgi:hypothetical protein
MFTLGSTESEDGAMAESKRKVHNEHQDISTTKVPIGNLLGNLFGSFPEQEKSLHDAYEAIEELKRRAPAEPTNRQVRETHEARNSLRTVYSTIGENLAAKRLAHAVNALEKWDPKELIEIAAECKTAVEILNDVGCDHWMQDILRRIAPFWVHRIWLELNRLGRPLANPPEWSTRYLGNRPHAIRTADVTSALLTVLSHLSNIRASGNVSPSALENDILAAIGEGCSSPADVARWRMDKGLPTRNPNSIRNRMSKMSTNGQLQRVSRGGYRLP